jgi:hypothetical protein
MLNAIVRARWLRDHPVPPQDPMAVPPAPELGSQ